MKKVLIVDDDAVTRGLLSRVLKPHAKNFEVLTAENGKEAATIINREHIDLVVTDLQMPVVDGFKLLSYMSKKYPETPVFVMTGFGSPKVEEKINAYGPSQYFNKPLNVDVLIECINDELQSGAAGLIRGISLPSFMQLVEMEKRTCSLHITSGNKTGKLYFVKGDLINAETGDLKSEEAAFELISWNKTQIEIEDLNKNIKKEIKQSLMNILMEGLTRKDEQEALNKTNKSPLKSLDKKQ